MKKRIKVSVVVAMLFWVLIIFYFSSQTGSVSNSQSNMALEFIRRLNALFDISANPLFIKWEIFFKEQILRGDYYSTGDVVRKSAHFGIYFILGVLSTVFGYFYSKKYLMGFLLGVCLPVTIAALDEYNQAFVGRTSRLDDVILDGMGAFGGTIIALAVIFVVRSITMLFQKSKKVNLKGSNR